MKQTINYLILLKKKHSEYFLVDKWLEKKFIGFFVVGLIVFTQVYVSAKRILNFPFSDYRMFSTSRSDKNIEIFIPFVRQRGEEIILLNSKSVYLSYCFILKDLWQKQNLEKLNRQLRGIYRELVSRQEIQLLGTVTLGLQKVTWNDGAKEVEVIYEFSL